MNWLLLILILPLSGEGLVTGWSAPYATQADCRKAQTQLVMPAGSHGSTVYAVAFCIPEVK